jgi:hypothetical protein
VVVRIVRFEGTYRCRRFIILVKAITAANPEPGENRREADYTESNPTCFNTYSPQGGYKCVDGKDLERDRHAC